MKDKLPVVVVLCALKSPHDSLILLLSDCYVALYLYLLLLLL